MKLSQLMIGLFSMFILTGVVCQKKLTEEELIQKAARIHKKVLTLDSHTDTPLRLLRDNFDISQPHDPHKNSSKIDFPRMKQGQLDAIFWAVFVGQGPRTPEGNAAAREKALTLFNLIHQTIEKHPHLAESALSPDDAYRLEKAGKCAIFIGIENGYPVGTDLTALKEFYELGARYITLCHTKNNDICDSSTDPNGPEYHGLSEFGKQVVAEMNRLGIIIDVSHISDEAFYDVLKGSRSPVIASHSCARAICDNPRNLDDEMLRQLAAKGGVIQMCILSDYVKTPPSNPAREEAFKEYKKKYKNFSQLSAAEQQQARQEWWALDEMYPQPLATVADVVDHIDHIVKLVGIDYLGIGTDFDGGGGVEGCYDVSEIGNITLELVKRGYSEKKIRKIWGGNFMRVFREVERIAREIQENES